MEQVHIRVYDPDVDEVNVLHLWQITLGTTWPISKDLFQNVTASKSTYLRSMHLIAEKDGVTVGFAASLINLNEQSSTASGNVVVLCVAPTYHRRGIGRQLHDTILEHFHKHGVDRVQLGAGANYFWPGVPKNLPVATKFFESCGWKFTETSYDLVQNLSDYNTPAQLPPRIGDLEMRLQIATQNVMPDVQKFVSHHFPSWRRAYQSVADVSDAHDCLIAYAEGGEIIGSLIMFGPNSDRQRHDVKWATLFGENDGAIGVVGVAGHARNQGVGHELVARASELLREQGVQNCYIGWAWMVGLYGDLGYRVWQEYGMSSRQLNEGRGFAVIELTHQYRME